MHVPPGTGPREFFEQLLPAEFARRVAAGQLAQVGDGLWVRVSIQGQDADGAGSWDMHASGGKLMVGQVADTSPPAPIWVRQSVADWAALVLGPKNPGAPGAFRLVPGGGSPADGFIVDAATRRLLGQVKGTLAFHIDGYEGRTWRLQLKLGTAAWPAAPESTITVGATDYALMMGGKLNPAEAFFQQKIRLAGNTALAMQLGMAILPRLAQRRP
jgi:hypothetical protein